MMARNRDPVAALVCSLQEEVEGHKWFESEKAGGNIGWENAFQSWMQRHFPDWKRFEWQQAVREVFRSSSKWGFKSTRLRQNP
jgi:hypothetical protein